MGAHRLPARTRILAAATLAIAVHLAFARDLEGVRIGVLAAIPALGGPGGIFAKPGASRGDTAFRAEVDAWRAARGKAVLADGRALVPVLAWNQAAQVAVIGAGAASGLRILDPVVVPAGLLGFIDAVQPHLSRVRLVSAARARVPVTLAESRPGLPGGMIALNAVLEGTGDGARLVEGPLLGEFRAGDRLNAVLDGTEGAPASRALPVGAVTVPGPRPAVRLFAGPGDLGLVAVSSTMPVPALFSDCVLEVRAAPLVGGSGALLAGPRAVAVAAGCAVLSRGRYLGRITRVCGEGAVASRISDRGHRVGVRWLAGNLSSTGELIGLGGGRFALEGAGPGPAEASMVAVTAGGQGLVPADLPVGILDRDGDGWRVRDQDGGWPAEVEVPVFTFGDELRQLLPR